MKSIFVVTAMAIALMTSGCVSNGSRPNNQYQSASYQSYVGVVTSVRAVNIDNSNMATKGGGALAGAALGAILGHQVGNGTGRTIATIAGAAAGGYGGMVASDAMTKSNGNEIRVRLDRGNDVVIMQEGPARVGANQRVRVIESSAGLQVEPL